MSGTAGQRRDWSGVVLDAPDVAALARFYAELRGWTILIGAGAGAAGTTALNAVTYLDMAVRARPSSSTPQETVDRLADLTLTGSR